jgi:MoaA/NifB/PqqE/SkfB family radical SAM enzyme
VFETKQLVDHMREATYLRTGLDVSRPSQVSIDITHRCNYRCSMCCLWRSADSPELATSAWLRIIEHLGRWPGPGTKLNISGGEPLLRKDLAEILTRASDVGLAAGIVTNGALLNETRALELVQARLFNVNISLDSLDPAVNDPLRGARGATEKAVAAIDLLSEAVSRQKSSLAIIVKPIAMEPTLDGLERLVEFAARRRISGVLLQAIINMEGDDQPGWREESALWPRDPVHVTRVFDRLISMKERGYPLLNSTGHLRSLAQYLVDPSSTAPGVCRVGTSNLSIWPDGSVKPLCELLPGPPSLGNLTTSTAQAIWKGADARVARRAILSCHRNCVLTCQRSRSIPEKVALYWQLRKAVRSRAR